MAARVPRDSVARRCLLDSSASHHLFRADVHPSRPVRVPSHGEVPTESRLVGRIPRPVCRVTVVPAPVSNGVELSIRMRRSGELLDSTATRVRYAPPIFRGHSRRREGARVLKARINLDGGAYLLHDESYPVATLSYATPAFQKAEDRCLRGPCGPYPV